MFLVCCQILGIFQLYVFAKKVFYKLVQIQRTKFMISSTFVSINFDGVYLEQTTPFLKVDGQNDWKLNRLNQVV